jgi:hypothetical protein
MRYINNKKSGNGFILSVICLHVQIYQCIVCTVCIGRGSMRQVTITIISVQCSYYIYVYIQLAKKCTTFYGFNPHVYCT